MRINTLTLLALFLLSSAVQAADPWGDRLRTVFPQAKIVETFDDIRPWVPSSGPGAITTNLPVKNNGTPSQINYYTNGTTNHTTTEHAIKDHGDAITGHAARLSFATEPVHQGIGHLGFMFGNGTPESGLRNMHVFWRLKFPKNVFPTSIVRGMGYYDSALPYCWSMPKLASFSHGVTRINEWNGVAMVTGYSQGRYSRGFPRKPYGTFSMVPQLFNAGSYVSTPTDLQTMRMTWASADMGTATWPGGAGFEAPVANRSIKKPATGTAGQKQGIATGSWIGLEFRVKLVDTAPGKDELQIWYYSPEGVKTELVNRADLWLHNIGISARHAWNFVFLGGNTSNTWLSIDSSMVGSYLVDDLVINDGPIGDAYFTALASYRKSYPLQTCKCPNGCTAVNNKVCK